jgi:glycine betaine/proline transport system substrate-binding protein
MWNTGRVDRSKAETFQGVLMRRSVLIVPFVAMSLLAAACGSKASDTGSDTTAAGADTTAAAAAAGEDHQASSEGKETIRIAQNAWTASAINTEIAKQLIEKHIGNKVEVVKIDENTQFAGLAAGDIDAVFEVWPSGVTPDEQKYFDDKQVVNAGPLGVVGQIGWFVPDYVLEKYPTLSSWEGLKDPAVAKAFASAETGDKGRFLATDPSYSQADAVLIKNLNLPFEVKYSGTEAATIAELDSKASAKEPVLMYWWTPTAAAGKYNLKQVPLPKNDGKCFSNEAATCDYPADPMFKAVSAKLAAKDAKVQAFIEKFSLTNDDQLKLLPAVEIDQKPAADIAAEWIAANEATWKAWLG